MAKFKVTFIVEGEWLADTIELCDEFLRVGVLNTFDKEHSTGSGGPDTTVSNIEIEELPTESKEE